MEKVFEFDRRRIYDLVAARQMLPLVFKITEEVSLKVQDLINRIDRLKELDEAVAKQHEEEVNRLISRWQGKMEKLGLQPKGLWIADFDSGDGYFCWKYPEMEIKFWHGYQDGFTGRISIEQKIFTQANKETNQKDH